MKLNAPPRDLKLFAEGVVGTEDLNLDISMNEGNIKGAKPIDDTFVMSAANAEAQEGSGVRARWVELPLCGFAAGNSSIPLEDDLSNATIATCKPNVIGQNPVYNGNTTYNSSGYTYEGVKPSFTNETANMTFYYDGVPPSTPLNATASANTTNSWEVTKYPVYSPSIYANTSGNTIPDHEHQVTQQQQGSVDPTSGMEGPLYLQVNNLKH